MDRLFSRMCSMNGVIWSNGVDVHSTSTASMYASGSAIASNKAFDTFRSLVMARPMAMMAISCSFVYTPLSTESANCPAKSMDSFPTASSMVCLLASTL